MKKNGPILITGTFRSGTTLIAQILKNHPEVELVYDSVNFMRFSYDRYNPLSQFSNVESLLTEIHKRISERWDMNFDYNRVIDCLKNQEITYGLIYDILMSELLLTKSEAEIWGEKTTLVWTKIPEFFKMFPNGRVIHIIRDPRAILSSWKKMTNAPGNDYLDAILNCQDSMAKMDQYKSTFKDKRYVAMKYEDLVDHPAALMKIVCEKLDLIYTDELLDAKMFADKAGKKWSGNSMHQDNVKGITKKLVDIWKTKLDNWEIYLTEHIVGKYMTTFDYKNMNIEKTMPLIQRISSEIASSELVTEGMLFYQLTNEGFERFPTDPLSSKNWATTKKID